MRRHWPLVAVPLAAIALAAIVGVLRRDSLASTPGEVVERFLDGVMRDRYEKAAPFLADGVVRTDTPAALKEWKQEVESGLGKVRRVRGETEWISGEQAEATGVLVAGKRERRLRFALEREGGRWRLARLDEFWGDDAGADGSLRVREAWRERRRPTRLTGRLR
ncbi:MAG TPA: hypothetical protein VGS98_12255 [Thermoanaerobaculia bacterium]|jgi:hypothetical protein|nr:hypothetical protein [Thermoanaerobaculia bacterium]